VSGLDNPKGCPRLCPGQGKGVIATQEEPNVRERIKAGPGSSGISALLLLPSPTGRRFAISPAVRFERRSNTYGRPGLR
jgi:hypothetical protein